MTHHQLAAQLYTVRSLCRTPLETAATLARIRAIGYEAVEVAGICPIEPLEMLKIAGDAGLRIAAIHDSRVLSDPAAVVECLNALNCDHVACSYSSSIDLSKEENVVEMLRSLRASAARFRAAGKKLCYHHHSFEFIRHGKKTLLEHLLNSIDPAEMSLELDTYWVQHGGGSPEQWCARFKNRFPIIHLKDYGIIDGKPSWTEVGRGNLDWEKIIPAARAAGCRWFVVEQDTCPGDPLESLKISHDYLRANFIS